MNPKRRHHDELPKKKNVPSLYKRVMGEKRKAIDCSHLPAVNTVEYHSRFGREWAEAYFQHGYWPMVKVGKQKDLGYGLYAKVDIPEDVPIAGYYAVIDNEGSKSEQEIYGIDIGKIQYNGVPAINSWSMTPGYQFVGGLANHSLKHPNACCRYSGIGELPHMFLIALRDIRAGEQIHWAYQDAKTKKKDRYPFYDTCVCCTCMPQLCGCSKHAQIGSSIVEMDCFTSTRRKVHIPNTLSDEKNEDTHDEDEDVDEDEDETPMFTSYSLEQMMANIQSEVMETSFIKKKAYRANPHMDEEQFAKKEEELEKEDEVLLIPRGIL